MKVLSFVVCSALLLGSGGSAIVDLTHTDSKVEDAPKSSELTRTVSEYTEAIDERIRLSRILLDNNNGVVYVATTK